MFDLYQSLRWPRPFTPGPLPVYETVTYNGIPVTFNGETVNWRVS